jgi:hypothetical protein
MVYAIIGIALAALDLYALFWEGTVGHHPFRLQDVAIPALLALTLLASPKTERLPILAMTATVAIALNQWLFGSGLFVHTLVLLGAVLTVWSGLAVRERAPVTTRERVIARLAMAGVLAAWLSGLVFFSGSLRW